MKRGSKRDRSPLPGAPPAADNVPQEGFAHDDNANTEDNVIGALKTSSDSQEAITIAHSEESAAGEDLIDSGPQGVDSQNLALTPRIPAFLCQDRNDHARLFRDIIWDERNRVLLAESSGDPNHPFRRVETPKTKPLDRYQNIQVWAGNRITLSVPQGKNDYINASPVKVKSRRGSIQRRFITMQGPKQNTVSHTWRMIFHELQSPAIIVMLTATHESQQEKCYPYFPRDPTAEPIMVNEKDEFGDGFKATVRCVEMETSPFPGAIEIRKLIMKEDGKEEEKIIWHMMYTAWPDFGVPRMDALEPLLALMELSRSKNATNPDNPRLVHCSAGVGRTGTFIALEHLLSELDAGAFDIRDDQTLHSEALYDPSRYDPVFDTVGALRTQRMSMVQAEIQYQFLYKVLRQAFERKYPGAKIFDDPEDGPFSSHDTNGEPLSKVMRGPSMSGVHHVPNAEAEHILPQSLQDFSRQMEEHRQRTSTAQKNTANAIQSQDLEPTPMELEEVARQTNEHTIRENREGSNEVNNHLIPQDNEQHLPALDESLREYMEQNPVADDPFR